ncbi:MAG: acyl carrier protein [Rhizobacter sp.]|nr:acyl carrier protein [Rhizobacter sp.]
MTPVTTGELATLIVESLGLEGVDPRQIDPTAPLFGEGLGLDSLDMLEISLVIQQQWGVKLRSDDRDNEAVFASLQSLATRIEAQRSAQSVSTPSSARSAPPA